MSIKQKKICQWRLLPLPVNCVFELTFNHFFDKKVNPFLFSFRVCSTPLARSVMCIGRFTTPCTSARRTPWSPVTREWPTMLRTTTRDISWTTFSRHWQSSVFVWFCVNTKSSVSKENSSWKDKYSGNPNYGLVQYSDHGHVSNPKMFCYSGYNLNTIY